MQTCTTYKLPRFAIKNVFINRPCCIYGMGGRSDDAYKYDPVTFHKKVNKEKIP